MSQDRTDRGRTPQAEEYYSVSHALVDSIWPLLFGLFFLATAVSMLVLASQVGVGWSVLVLVVAGIPAWLFLDRAFRSYRWIWRRLTRRSHPSSERERPEMEEPHREEPYREEPHREKPLWERPLREERPLRRADRPAPNSAGSRIGGVPLAPADTPWPKCLECGGPMQFLAQISLSDIPGSKVPDEGRLLLFQCQNNPGMCDEWDPDLGGNRALVVDEEAAVPLEPPSGETTLGVVLPVEGACRLGGEPDWIQVDRTPQCCGRPMVFVAQLDNMDVMNFGDGGDGYAFLCAECGAAKFLWQCF